MGKNKRLRKGIRSLERRIHEHEDKIAIEREHSIRMIVSWHTGKRRSMADSDKSKANEKACRGGYELCL